MVTQETKSISFILNDTYQIHFNDSIVPFTGIEDLSVKLYYAPFMIYAFEGGENPSYIYMNLAAQRFFEIEEHEVKSSKVLSSIDPLLQSNVMGFYNEIKNRKRFVNYSSSRITKSGKRVRFENAYQWVLEDDNGNYIGQACLEPLF